MKLSLNGWRGRTIQGRELPPRLLLSAPNGAGKTNILEAIEACLTRQVLRRGKDASNLIPFLDDGAEVTLAGDGWSSTAKFRRTPKGAKLDQEFKRGLLAETPIPRAIFIDFGRFIDATASERAAMLDGLIAYSEPEAVKAAKIASENAGVKVLLPEAEPGAIDIRAAFADRLQHAEILEALHKVLAAEGEPRHEAALEVARRVKVLKASSEEMLNQAPVETADPEQIAVDLEAVRQQVANIEAQDRDAAAIESRRALLESRLRMLGDWSPEEDARLRERIAAIEATPAFQDRTAELTLKVEQARADGKAATEEYQALASGRCPTCGHPVDPAKSKAALAKVQALGQAFAAAKQELAAWQTVKEAARQKISADRLERIQAQEKIAKWGHAPAETIAQVKAQLEGLPRRFDTDPAALDALRRKAAQLAGDLSRAQQARAAVAVISKAELPRWELAGKVARALWEGWKDGWQAYLKTAVGPIEEKMSKALGLPVTLDPAAGWAITVGGRDVEALSGGERLVTWAAFAAALARASDILLGEIAEADPEKLALLLAALRGSPFALIILATHVAGVVGSVATGWESMDPRDLEVAK